MKIHLRADEANETHTKFTVFVNDVNCGQLCMKREEAFHFHDMIIGSRYKIEGDNYYSSGIWIKR